MLRFESLLKVQHKLFRIAIDLTHGINFSGAKPYILFMPNLDSEHFVAGGKRFSVQRPLKCLHLYCYRHTPL